MPDNGMRQALRRLLADTLHGNLARIERRSHGSRATFVGNNRLRPFGIEGKRPRPISWDDLAGLDVQAGILLRRGG